MLERVHSRLSRVLVLLFVLFVALSFAPKAAASPFGEGVFGANIPFGALTSLAINLGGNVSLSLTPSGTTFTGSGAHTITVTSTDAVGYNLYVYGASGTNMSNGTDSIPTSSNGSAAPLSANTWGYNTTGSTTNYLGMTTAPALIKSAIGPYKTGDTTTVTYGLTANISKSAGKYSVGVIYTAVAMND